MLSSSQALNHSWLKFWFFAQVVRAGINVDIAPDLIANQLNVRDGALILQVDISQTSFFFYITDIFPTNMPFMHMVSNPQVPANSPAAKAGLLPTTRGFAGNIVLGDIIAAIDNKPVSSSFFPNKHHISIGRSNNEMSLQNI